MGRQGELPPPPISNDNPGSESRQSVMPSVTREDIYTYINYGVGHEQVPSSDNMGNNDSYTGLRSGYIEPAARQSVAPSENMLPSGKSDVGYGYINEKGKQQQVYTGGDIVGIQGNLPPGGNDWRQETSAGEVRNNETGKEGNNAMYVNEGQTQGGYIND